MRRFQDLDIWVSAHQLTLDAYRITGAFPSSELYGLTSQLRRAAASIPSNIAEGSVKGPAEFHQALRIAHGSSAEVEYQLLLARDLDYLTATDYERIVPQLLSLQRRLVAFMKALRNQQRAATGTPARANGAQPRGQRPEAIP